MEGAIMQQAVLIEVRSGTRSEQIDSKKRKEWSTKAPERSTFTLEGYEKRLREASKRREAYKKHGLRLRVRKSNVENNTKHIAQRLQKRLDAAHQKRADAINRVRSRAAAHSAHTAALVEARKQQETQARLKLESSIEAARQSREQRLAELSRKAAEHTQHTKLTSEAVKRKDQEERERMRLALDAKLENAQRRRKELALFGTGLGIGDEPTTNAVDASSSSLYTTTPATTDAMNRQQQTMPSSDNTTPATNNNKVVSSSAIPNTSASNASAAAPFAARHISAARIQRSWRRFVALKKTTATLATAFDQTGIPWKTSSSNTLSTDNATTTIKSSPMAVPIVAPNTPPQVAPNPVTGSVSPMIVSPVGSHKLRSAHSVADVAQESHHVEQPVNAFSVPHRENFDTLAEVLSSPKTLKATQVLLSRIQNRGGVYGVLSDGCDALLNRLFPPRQQQQRATNTTGQQQQQRERYPPRVFLCAYMILQHPEVVFNSQGEREASLSATAQDMTLAFQHLVDYFIITTGTTTKEGGQAMIQIKEFDAKWVAYLEQFVAWKSADAAGLERELIRMAVELESSKLQKVIANKTVTLPKYRSDQDIAALAAHVEHDLQLIKERVQRLTGMAGIARLDAALNAARATASQQQQKQQQAAAEEEQEAEQAASPRTTSVGLRSPTQSPIKKVPRLSSAGSGSNTSNNLVHAVDMEAALSSQLGDNLPLAWQLVYDPAWRLPEQHIMYMWTDATGETDPMKDDTTSTFMNTGEEQEQQKLQTRVRRIAERAFWDGVAEQLTAGNDSSTSNNNSAVEQAVDIICSLGQGLLETLPEGSTMAQDIASRLTSRDGILNQLTVNSSGSNGTTTTEQMLPDINGSYLFELLEWSAHLLKTLGSPARDAAAEQATAQMRRRLAQATTTASVANAIAGTLRLLRAQLELLRLDLANAKLNALVNTLAASQDGMLGYVTGKMQQIFGSTTDTENHTRAVYWAQRLPHARAWLAVASGQQLHTAVQLLASSSSSLEVDTSSTSSALPSSIRSGLGSSSETTTSKQQQRLIIAPVEAKSWRGLVRCALVELLSTAASRPANASVSETLVLDLSRIHKATNSFQKMVVVATCLGLVANTSTTDVSMLKQRLSALLADPNVRLTDLALELANHNKNSSSTTNTSSGDANEAQIAEQLRVALGRNGATLKAVSSGLGQALVIWLLSGSSSSSNGWAESAVRDVLSRCGCLPMLGEARELAVELSAICAVNETVFEPWYKAITQDLLNSL